MNVKYLLKLLFVSTILVSSINFSSIAQYGDYSVNIIVEHPSSGDQHDVNVIFADDFFGNTPTNAWDICCDSYALPPAFGQPMVYTSITEAPFPSGTNEVEWNTRPLLTSNWSVPLGFYTGAGSSGDYILTFDWIYTIPGNIGVELEDLQLGVTQDLLTDTTYNFSGTSSDSEARFMLHFTFGGGCTEPDVPAITVTPNTICPSGSSTLSWTGNLNDAIAWHVYTTSCGVTQLTTTASNSLVVSPASTTTYFIRGEDGAGCVDESTGLCGSETLTVNALDDASFSYSIASYCASGANQTPTISGVTGGSFSSAPAGLSIDAGSGIVNLSASTPGAYTVTYTTAGSCPNSSDVNLSVTDLDDASFSYSAGSYCATGADETPTISGVVGGTFSSAPAGLSIDAGTGEVNLSASTPGVYTVTYTTAGGCQNASDVSLSVTDLDDASFAYSAASYCTVDVDPTPTISGLAGGSFSAEPSGLIIDGGSGLVDLSLSTLGAYIVTYTAAGSCPNSSDVSLNVSDLDDASFSYSAAAYCTDESDQIPTISGVTGGSFSSTPAGLNIDAGSGIVDLPTSTPGTYTVKYTTTGSCANSYNQAFTVTDLDDASFAYSAASYCAAGADETPTISGVAGGAFSSAPAGLSIDAGTGMVDLSASTPGNYTVTYTTAGSCANSSDTNLSVTELDDASFSYAAAAYCADEANQTPTISGVTGGSFSSTPAGLSVDAGSGMVDLSASTPGNYTVTYTTAGSCANSSDISLSVTDLDDASFAYSAASYCASGVNQTPTIAGVTGGEFSSAPAGLSIDAGTGEVNLSASTPGAYTVTYTTAGSCPNSSNQAITVTDLNDASFAYSAASYCAADANQTPTISGVTGGSFSSAPAGLSINAGTGEINLSTSISGAYTVTYTNAGSCPNSSDVNLSVTDLDDASFFYADLEYCTDEADQTPTISGVTGGSFSSAPAGLSIDAATGEVNLLASTPGAYIVTYTTAGSCANASDQPITVTDLDDASFVYSAASYCASGADQTPTISGVAGGAFSSTPSGLSINVGTGEVNLSASTPGVYTVTYITSGSCPNSSNQAITITDLDDASFAYFATSYCAADANQTPIISGVTGGTFSSTPAGLSINAGTGEVNLSTSTPGAFIITYTTTGGCANSSDVSFSIDITPISALCQNVTTYLDGSGAASITASDIDGGSTYCGSGSLSANITSFTCADVGLNDVILTVEDGVSNTSTCTAQVTVLDTVSPAAICQNISVYLDASGNASITAGDIDGGSTDNCGTITLTADITSFTCADTGPNSVILNVEDGSSNTSSCTAQVTVLDTISPAAICQNITVYLDNTGNATINGTDVIGSSADNCDIVDPSMMSIPISCGQVGVNIVSVPVSDVNGNVSQCLATVTILDTVSPVVVCQDVTVYLDASGVAVISANDIDNGSLDNCGIADLALDNTSFTCSDLGVVAITLTATDSSGNTKSCSAFATVLDTISPQAICQNVTVYLDGTGNAIIDALDVDGGSSDNCIVASRSLSATNFDCSSLGANNTTLTIIDSSGNSNTCAAIVTVLDTTPPAITCPIVPAQCGDNVSGGIVTFTLPTATDNCSANVTQIDATSLTSGSFFPTGTTTLTYEAEDANGNTATCSFDVVVLPQPEAGFVHTPACLSEAMFFTDESNIDPSGTIVSWLWDMGDGSGPINIVDPTHVYAGIGTYTVTLTVESADACTDTYTTVVTVTEVPLADFSATTECLGTATIFTNNSDIDPGYTGGLNYFWDFGDGTSSADQSPTHIYASDGTFTASLTVTTDDGCEDLTTNSVTVLEQPTALFVYSETCLGSSTVFTDLSAGSSLTYEWDFGDSNSSTEQNPTHTYATAGIKTVVLTVTGGNGCLHSVSMNVLVSDYPTVGFTFSDACEETEVAFTNTSESGTYAWNFDDGNSSILSNPSTTYLNSGTYDVTLTITNPNSCVNQLTQQIEIFDNPELTLIPSDVLCFDDATGNILVSPTVGTAPLDFILDGGAPQISSTFSNLSIGTYTITVTDANGCSTSEETTISQPDELGINVNDYINILCHGDATGTIDVSGTGGTNPYTYTLDGGVGQSSGFFSDLLAGTHNLNISDGNGCSFDTTMTLTEPDALVLIVDSISNLLCNGDSSGWIGVSGTGGVMPYEYSIDGVNFDLPNLFNTLNAGDHTLIVTDANECTDTLNVTLTEPGVLMLSLLGTTDALCNGQSTGSVSVDATSGTPPYQFSIDGGGNWQASGEFPGIGAGIYTVISMDVNGCAAEVDATVGEPSLLTITTGSAPVFCVGDSTGTIDIVAGGGTPSYMYSIDGGLSFQTTSSYSDLSAGSYVTVIQDSLGCTISESVVISQPTNALFGSALIQSILCFGDSTGMIQVQATGGTGSYNYSIDAGVNWQLINSFENLTAGIYDIILEDVNGCTFTVEAEVGAPSDSLEILEVIIEQPSCPGEANGTIAIQASGGTAPYQYSSNGGVTFITNSLFIGATAASYDLVVMDDFGCLTSQMITVVDPESMVLTIDSIVKVNCDGDSDGLIYVSASGGTGSITYQLNGAAPQTTGEFNGIANGLYNIEATDSLGCSVELTINASAENPLPVPDFTFLVAGETVAFTNTSSFSDSYSWDFGDGTGTSTDENPTYTYDAPGNYDVTLSVTNDCGTVNTTFTISTIVFGVEDVDLLEGLNIYPNPSHGEFTLSFNLNEYVDAMTISVFDLRGRSVYNQNEKNLNGEQNVTINLIDASKGVYRLQLIADDVSQTIRIVIAK
jgi:PKD repeat protein